jgi:hypothetical protein
MEVVSTLREACLRSARARDIGIDRLLGGTEVEEVLEILAGAARFATCRSPAGRSSIRPSSRTRSPRSRTIAAGSSP